MRQDLAGVAVIFDLDGTFIDTAGDLAEAMNVALAAEGLGPMDHADVRHLVGQGARVMLREGFAAHGRAPDEADLDRHQQVFLNHYRAHIAVYSRPFPGAVEAAAALRAAGAKLAICTNKREEPARLLLDTLSLTSMFASIVGMDTTEERKPHPAPVRRCLDETGAKRAVFVGDSDTDVRAAAATTLPCLFAEFGYGPAELAGEAFSRFSDYDELPGLVRRALGA